MSNKDKFLCAFLIMAIVLTTVAVGAGLVFVLGFIAYLALHQK